MTNRPTMTSQDLVQLALAQSLIEFDPLAVEFIGDGSIVLHADPDIVVPTIKLGHYRQLMPLDDKYFPESNGKPPAPKKGTKVSSTPKGPLDEEDVSWDHFAQWLVETLLIFDVKRDIDSLPGWTLDSRLRARMMRHWQTVPFARPAPGG